MGLKEHAIVSCILALVLLNSMLVSSSAAEVDDESEFNYVEGGPIGPEHWGDIHVEWALCSNGTMQSPIDIPYPPVTEQPRLGPLQRFYRLAPAVLKNRGHDIMLEWQEDAGYMAINKTDYSLKQVHWHSPTEHAINGQRYDLEMHMVHESADGKNAVVGILYTIGSPDPFLAGLEEYVERMVETSEEEVAVGGVDPWRILAAGSWRYFRYTGSLTTPPCTEHVAWTIIKQVRTVSMRQVQLLREAVHDGFEMNARPIQDLNGRVVGFYPYGRLASDFGQAWDKI